MLTDALTQLYGASKAAQKLCALVTLIVLLIIATVLIYFLSSVVINSFAGLQERKTYLGNLLLITEAGKGLDAENQDPAPDPEALFFNGNNREVVGAELQNWLNAAAQDAGVQLQSIEMMAGGDDQKQSYVGLTANIFGAWNPLQNVIYKIETSQPMLFVRELEIHSATSIDENVEPQLTMRISFRGATQISSGDKHQ